jgi:hypothetical protein
MSSFFLERSMTTLLYLICGHYLADFGLQNEFTARFKVPGSAPYWLHIMVSHCAIQALPVLIVTGSNGLALAEFVTHMVIDTLKCKGKLTFNQDQALHLLCKVIWFGSLRLM